MFAGHYIKHGMLYLSLILFLSCGSRETLSSEQVAENEQPTSNIQPLPNSLVGLKQRPSFEEPMGLYDEEIEETSLNFEAPKPFGQKENHGARAENQELKQTHVNNHSDESREMSTDAFGSMNIGEMNFAFSPRTTSISKVHMFRKMVMDQMEDIQDQLGKYHAFTYPKTKIAEFQRSFLAGIAQTRFNYLKAIQNSSRLFEDPLIEDYRNLIPSALLATARTRNTGELIPAVFSIGPFLDYTLHQVTLSVPRGLPIVEYPYGSTFRLRRDPLCRQKCDETSFDPEKCKKKCKMKFHNGVDIRCPIGTQVHTPMAGVIAYIGPYVGYGYVVIVKNDPFELIFGHLTNPKNWRSDLDVYVGKKVDYWDVVAISGDTGYTTGPNLHYIVTIGGYATNPLRTVEGLTPKEMSPVFSSMPRDLDVSGSYAAARGLM